MTASPDRRRIRLPWWYLAPALLPAGVFLLGSAEGRTRPPGSLLAMLLLVLPAFALNRWFGITLTPSHAVVNNLRRRKVSWSDVQAVTTENLLGAWRTVLWTSTERVPLRAPMTFIGSLGAERFERDFHAIGQWWLAHRGADWQPARAGDPVRR